MAASLFSSSSSVLFEIFVDRTADVPVFIGELLALPFDIAFVATSLMAALVILSTEDRPVRLGLFALSIVIGGLAVVMFRKSERLFEADKRPQMFSLFALNLACSLAAVTLAVQLLAGEMAS